ncbi:MAG TPA: Ig-like domain-containing protein [Acidimicrobiia bacterium]|jgi:hypothetical protein|nr:Ig-like domain-containing protein [Acidimicrobiia bacterium]
MGPTVTLTAPLDGATLAGGSVAVSADATDAVGVAGVEFFAGGLPLGIDTDGTDGWSVGWDTTLAPDGPVTLQATATDNSGFSDTDSNTVKVDNARSGVAVMVVGNPVFPPLRRRGGQCAAGGPWLHGHGRDDNGVTAGAGAGTSFVLVSSNVSGGGVGGAFYSAGYPVLMSKPWLLDNMGMTGTQSGTDFGTTSGSAVTIADPTHPTRGAR